MHEVSSHIEFSKIYASLDRRSFQLFHGAMRRSRGGVLRAADLRFELATHAADCCPESLPSGWLMMPRVTDASVRDGWPTENDLELRSILQHAYGLARQSRTRDATVITPQILWRAALFADRQVAQSACSPFSSRAPIGLTSRPSSEKKSSAVVAHLRPRWTREVTRESMASILTDWLELQAVEDIALRREKVEALSRRTTEFEELAV